MTRTERPGAMLLLRWLIIFAALVWLSPSYAATPDARADSVVWAQTIDEARQALDADDGDDLTARIAALEETRATLASERDAALVRARAEPMEVQVLERRIASIGPPPADGGYEASTVTERRSGLEQQLERMTATQRAYEERYLRIVVMIERLDARIAALNNRLLFTRATSPALPGAWSAFIAESQTKYAQFSALGGTAMGAALSFLLVLLGAIGIPIFLQRRLARPINRRIEAKPTLEEATGWLVLRDVMTLAVMLIALLFVIVVLSAFGSDSPALKAYATILLAFGANTLLAYWLATALFAPRLPSARFVPLSSQGANLAVWIITAMGIASGFEGVLEEIEKASPFTSRATGASSFLIILALGVLLFMLGRTLLRTRADRRKRVQDGEVDVDYVEQNIDWLGLFARAMQYAAVAATLLALVGYIALARRVLLPTVSTLAILFILVLTYDRTLRIARLVLSRIPGKEARTSVMGRFLLLAFLALVGIPTIALIWGVRMAEITDFIVLLRDGISIGNTTVSLGTIVTLVGVFAVGYILTRWAQRLLQTVMLPRLEMDKGTQSAIVTGVGYVGVLLAVIVAIAAAGIDLSSLTIVLGALSVGIGFGLQGVVANFVSGIILLLERPIKEGDSVDIAGFTGVVDKISVRATRIQAFNHDDVIIPNSELISGIVRNRTFNDPVTRVECDVGIAYDSDVQKAFEILLEIGNAHPNTVQDPPPKVQMEALADSALAVKLLVFIDDVGNSVSVRTDLYVEILKRFHEAGIDIPFPQRDVRFSLPGSGAKDA